MVSHILEFIWQLTLVVLKSFQQTNTCKYTLAFHHFMNNNIYRFTLDNPGPWLNIKMPSYQWRKSHCGCKTVVRSCCLHKGVSYISKMASLFESPPGHNQRTANRNGQCHCWILRYVAFWHEFQIRTFTHWSMWLVGLRLWLQPSASTEISDVAMFACGYLPLKLFRFSRQCTITPNRVDNAVIFGNEIWYI